MGRNGHRGGANRDERDYDASAEYDAVGDESAYGPAYGDGDDSAYGPAYDGTDERGALVPLGDESANLPAVQRREAGPPVIIPGTGVSMGNPFIARRERPLTMRLAMITLAICILVTGLFAVTPLAGADASGLNTFQALAGSLVLNRQVGYTWYVAQAGDNIETIAARFNVQIGGIMELNNMMAGQEIQIGQKYKIPQDPFYGKNYRPTQPNLQGNGTTTFGNDWWNSYAGDPLPGALCAPYDGTPLGYHLVTPNPNSSWARGYSWFHNGVDISAPYGNTVVSPQDGQVLFAGWTNTGFGYAIKINFCNHLSALFGHNAQLLVKAGDIVHAGQPIALEGSTGWSTGPHVHMSVFVDNQFVDPCTYYDYGNGCVYNMTHLDTRYVTYKK